MANTKNKENINKATPKADRSTAGNEAKIPEKPIVAKDIDPNQYVTVRNGFQGTLIYISPRTGEKFRWGKFGEEQEIELRELRNAKSSSKKMFENNWFMFDEDWIIDYLGVRQYYKHAVSIDEFDELFNKTPAELKNILSEMSDGQKKSVAYRARQLIAEDVIDSRKIIATLEECLDSELIEK